MSPPEHNKTSKIATLLLGALSCSQLTTRAEGTGLRGGSLSNDNNNVHVEVDPESVVVDVAREQILLPPTREEHADADADAMREELPPPSIDDLMFLDPFEGRMLGSDSIQPINFAGELSSNNDDNGSSNKKNTNGDDEGEENFDPFEKFIVKGSTLNNEEWPSVGITLEWKVKNGKGQYYRGMCGCTLIANKWAMTAAHCVSNYRTNDLAAKLDGVMLNAKDPFNVVNGKGNGGYPFQKIGVKKIWEQPNHKPGSASTYDIALLELEHEAHPYITKHIMPLATCSYINALRDGTQMTALGMGQESHGGAKATKMKKVNVGYVSWNTCQKAMGQHWNFDHTMMCAGGKGSGDACGGDSGSCLVHNAKVINGKGGGVQTGVVSWGHKCNQPGYPGVYSNVCKSLSWIQSMPNMDGLKIASAPGGNSGNIQNYQQSVPAPAPAPAPKPAPAPSNRCKDATNNVKYYDEKKGKDKHTTCAKAAQKTNKMCSKRTPSDSRGDTIRDICPVTCRKTGC